MVEWKTKSGRTLETMHEDVSPLESAVLREPSNEETTVGYAVVGCLEKPTLQRNMASEDWRDEQEMGYDRAWDWTIGAFSTEDNATTKRNIEILARRTGDDAATEHGIEISAPGIAIRWMATTDANVFSARDRSSYS
jgi:hypothetical protein